MPNVRAGTREDPHNWGEWCERAGIINSRECLELYGQSNYCNLTAEQSLEYAAIIAERHNCFIRLTGEYSEIFCGRDYIIGPHGHTGLLKSKSKIEHREEEQQLLLLCKRNKTKLQPFERRVACS